MWLRSGATAEEKSYERMMNEKYSREYNDSPSFFIDNYEKELRSFMYIYKGATPAWDFIQYLIHKSGLRKRTGFFK